jgi:hypothetical protein
MENTSKTDPIPSRELVYRREMAKNQFYDAIVRLFAEAAEQKGLNKRALSASLDKDPALITRLLAHPSNLTIETISDLLLAMGYVPELRVKPLQSDDVANNVHPWLAEHADRGRGKIE